MFLIPNNFGCIMKDFLTTLIEKQQPYGLLWTIVTAIFLVSVVVVIVYAKRIDNTWQSRIFIAVGGLLLVSEILKQLAVGFIDGKNGGFYFDFGEFAWQPSSVTMYAIFVVGFLSKARKSIVVQNDNDFEHTHAILDQSKVRSSREFVCQCLCAYIATYGLFGGFSAFALPQTIFNTNSAFSLSHSIILHFFMALCAVFLICKWDYKDINRWLVLKAFCVFLIAAVVAMAINMIAHAFGQNAGLFFIDPYSGILLPIVGDIFEPILKAHKWFWSLYIPIFLAGFSVFVFAVFYFSKLCKCIVFKAKNKTTLEYTPML